MFDVRSLVWGLLALCGGCVEKPKCDLSSDEKVRVHYQKLTGEALDTDRPCMERAGTFPGVVRIGEFAHDHGCRWTHIIAACQLDPPDGAAKSMAAAGWGKADAEKRVKLARAWLTESEGVDMLLSQPAGWPSDKAYRSPAGEATADGGLVMRYWVQGRIGKRPGRRYWQEEVKFRPDGTHEEAKTVEKVEISSKDSDP